MNVYKIDDDASGFGEGKLYVGPSMVSVISLWQQTNGKEATEEPLCIQLLGPAHVRAYDAPGSFVELTPEQYKDWKRGRFDPFDPQQYNRLE